jgi:hypothetical protein
MPKAMILVGLIENALDIVSSRLQKILDLSPRNFEAVVRHEWETIPYSAHCAVFNSICKGLSKCIANDGETTHYKVECNIWDMLACKSTQ